MRPPRRFVFRDLVRGLRSFGGDPSAQVVLAMAGGVITIGTVFYRVVEDLPWIDGLYFSVITLSTVGYGDISPTTTAGKIFTMGYVIVGIGIFVTLVTLVAEHLIEARRDAFDERSVTEQTPGPEDTE